jgi:hypothetical protein
MNKLAMKVAIFPATPVATASRALAILLVVSGLMSPGRASAGGLLDFIDPTKVPRAILNGKNPIEAKVDQKREQGTAAGRVVRDGTQAVGELHATIVDLHRDRIRRTFGPEWVRAYDLLHAPQRTGFEAAMSGSRLLGHCLQGDRCTVEEIAAMPLAEALRDAWKEYAPYARPLPLGIQHKLRRVLPPEIVAGVRYVVADLPDLTVLGMLNAANGAFGTEHAVTIPIR